MQARKRVPRGEFVYADLGEELTWLADNSVDVVLCQHVFSHLEMVTTPLNEFARVLDDGGDLLISTHNPIHEYLVVRDENYPSTGDEPEATVETNSGSPDYAETERYDIHWGTDTLANRGTYYRRSIESLLSPLLAAGFELQAVEEPTPDEAFAREHPELTRALRTHPPESICLRATIGGSDTKQ
ncbi:class I SAM-dependent methyltransferase [Halocatena halophila]|uniref:class I SAM-dependent methyltransferase n=1 Tax=Halocatena halophila TaxID=2814576 RepID=UPI002ED26F24